MPNYIILPIWFTIKIRKGKETNEHILAWLRDHSGNCYDLGTDLSKQDMHDISLNPKRFVKTKNPTVAFKFELDVNGEIYIVPSDQKYASSKTAKKVLREFNRNKLFREEYLEEYLEKISVLDNVQT
jgi:hypothetical protein